MPAPFCLGQSMTDGDEEGTVTTHGAGILYGVGCFKSPLGSSGKAGHGSIPRSRWGPWNGKKQNESGVLIELLFTVELRLQKLNYVASDTGRQSWVSSDQLQRSSWPGQASSRGS